MNDPDFKCPSSVGDATRRDAILRLAARLATSSLNVRGESWRRSRTVRGTVLTFSGTTIARGARRHVRCTPTRVTTIQTRKPRYLWDEKQTGSLRDGASRVSPHTRRRRARNVRVTHERMASTSAPWVSSRAVRDEVRRLERDAEWCASKGDTSLDVDDASSSATRTTAREPRVMTAPSQPDTPPRPFERSMDRDRPPALPSTSRAAKPATAPSADALSIPSDDSTLEELRFANHDAPRAAAPPPDAAPPNAAPRAPRAREEPGWIRSLYLGESGARFFYIPSRWKPFVPWIPVFLRACQAASTLVAFAVVASMNRPDTLCSQMIRRAGGDPLARLVDDALCMPGRNYKVRAPRSAPRAAFPADEP